MKTFEQCCEYLGIDNALPTCQIDEKKFQAAYKLRVCTTAWNKQDGFVPDEIAGYLKEETGFIPHFNYKDGRLLSSGNAAYGSVTGIAYGTVYYTTAYPYAHFGLRLSLKTRDRAVEFGRTFINIFNELI